jgi:hypothetical protein
VLVADGYRTIVIDVFSLGRLIDARERCMRVAVSLRNDAVLLS